MATNAGAEAADGGHSGGPLPAQGPSPFSPTPARCGGGEVATSSGGGGRCGDRCTRGEVAVAAVGVEEKAACRPPLFRGSPPFSPVPSPFSSSRCGGQHGGRHDEVAVAVVGGEACEVEVVR